MGEGYSDVNAWTHQGHETAVDPIDRHIELELRGYLAAIDEGLPVTEPKSALITAFVLGQVATWLARWIISSVKAASTSMTRRTRAIHERPPAEQDGGGGARSAIPQRRLVFVRYLYERGLLHG